MDEVLTFFYLSTMYFHGLLLDMEKYVRRKVELVSILICIYLPMLLIDGNLIPIIYYERKEYKVTQNIKDTKDF